MDENETSEQDIARVRKHAVELGEHFDAVQIFCSRHEAGTLDGTISVNLGSGNWYARFGQVVDWTIKNDERVRLAERKDNQE